MGYVAWIRAGAILGGLGVAAGAFGAHALRGLVEDGRWTPRQFEAFEVAVRYQLVHALALVAVGLVVRSFGPSRAASIAGWAFLVGTLLFSGSLYAMVLVGGVKEVAMLTPIGGVGFLVGWAALASVRAPAADRGA